MNYKLRLGAMDSPEEPLLRLEHGTKRQENVDIKIESEVKFSYTETAQTPTKP